jgi:hypothetical protein
MPASSDAQHPERAFPAGHDPGEVASVKAGAESADGSWRGMCESSGPQAAPVPAPYKPEIRGLPVQGAGFTPEPGDEH